MNVVAFPLEQLGGDVLAAILRGGLDVVVEAGASVVGGHSIKDDEPKYGMAVTGIVDPRRIVTNAGGMAGDALVLTKPLGVGAIVTAAKRGDGRSGTCRRRRVGHGRAERCGVAGRAGCGRPRDDRCHRLRPARPPAHLARESGAGRRNRRWAVPAIDGVALRCWTESALSGGSKRNADWAATFATIDAGVPVARRLLVDATTSGGLLAAVPRDRAVTHRRTWSACDGRAGTVIHVL